MLPSPLKILVAEDDPLILSMAMLELEDAGYGVIGAAHGGQALQLLQDEIVVDFLLTDIRMPEVDGWQVAKAYRQRFPDLPVLYTTGYAEKLDPVPGGIVLPKPYKMSRVLGILKTLLA